MLKRIKGNKEISTIKGDLSLTPLLFNIFHMSVITFVNL